MKEVVHDVADQSDGVDLAALGSRLVNLEKAAHK